MCPMDQTIQNGVRQSWITDLFMPMIQRQLACHQGGVLKMAIMHRKNSLFYKTEHGAYIEDMFMSLIHTCSFSKINPFDYLAALQKHTSAVFKNPYQWLPWNYQENLAPFVKALWECALTEQYHTGFRENRQACRKDTEFHGIVGQCHIVIEIESDLDLFEIEFYFFPWAISFVFLEYYPIAPWTNSVLCLNNGWTLVVISAPPGAPC